MTIDYLRVSTHRDYIVQMGTPPPVSQLHTRMDSLQNLDFNFPFQLGKLLQVAAQRVYDLTPTVVVFPNSNSTVDTVVFRTISRTREGANHAPLRPLEMSRSQNALQLAIPLATSLLLLCKSRPQVPVFRSLHP